MAGIPVVVTTEHLPCVIERPGERSFKRRINRLADRVIAVSSSVGRTLVRAGLLSEAQLAIIPNGIDLTRFRHLRPPAPARELRRIHADAFIGTIGRMTEQKGHIHLLRAIPTILSRYPEARFVWIGDGPERPFLETQAQRLGVLSNVWFMGRQPEGWRWLPVFDFTVLPSLFEGLPLAALESLAAGRAVVGARVCGTMDAVSHGETGLLVEPRDPDALAAAILRLMDHPKECASMGALARRRMEAEFSVQRMAGEHDDLYRRLLAGKTQIAGLLGKPPIQPVFLPERTRPVPTSTLTPTPTRARARTALEHE